MSRERLTWRALGPLYDLMVALQFLTRLPMPRDLDPDAEALGRAAVHFPVVGVLVGALMAALSVALSWTPWSASLQLALVLVGGVLLTGAFHEDGLADTFDGLWGGWRREDVLRIMRDSRIGTYGSAALWALLALRFGALDATDRAQWPTAFVLAHALGRASSLPLLAALPYARAERAPGQVKPLVAGLTRQRFALGMAAAALICVAALGPEAGLGLMFGVMALAALTGLYYMKRLGGMTGDMLGATNVLCEVSVLLAFAWGHPAP